MILQWTIVVIHDYTEKKAITVSTTCKKAKLFLKTIFFSSLMHWAMYIMCLIKK